MKTRLYIPARALLCLLALGAASLKASALTCYALTSTDHLLTFDSAAPGSVTDNGAILFLTGYTLLGIDIRTTTQTIGAANPGLGSLWAIGRNGVSFQLFVITPSTPPVASTVGGPLSGIDDNAGDNGWGFGFDPTIDRLRFIGAQNNYLIDPNTATYVRQPNLVAAGNLFPAVSGAAYTTASFGSSSRVYSLDNAIHALLVSNDLSTGILTQVGAGLGPINTEPNGLDIFESTSLWAGSPGAISALYSVNLTTGAATLIGSIFGNPLIRGLAIVPTSFPPVLSVNVRIRGAKRSTVASSTKNVAGTARSEAGIKGVNYRIGKRRYKMAKGTTNWTFKARLRKGLNVVSVTAVGKNDVVSPPAKVRITREE